MYWSLVSGGKHIHIYIYSFYLGETLLLAFETPMLDASLQYVGQTHMHIIVDQISH
jgi:hypothetical protein